MDVYELLISLILDGKMHGRINQVEDALEINSHCAHTDTLPALRILAENLQGYT